MKNKLPRHSKTVQRWWYGNGGEVKIDFFFGKNLT